MAAGYTNFQYGNVRIERCFTRRFEQTPVFESSDSDVMHHRFTIRVSGIVHAHTDWPGAPGIGGQTVLAGGNSAANVMRSIRHQLSEPRRSFEMRMGVTPPNNPGTVILKADPVPLNPPRAPSIGLYDVNNGPKCRVIDITRLVADEVFSVECEFEVCKIDCDGGDGAGQNGTGILSNRWSITDDIDANRFTIRTYEGLLRTFSGRVNPNAFRSYVVPSLAPGMRRERMTFTATEDGLALKYTIVDKEVAFSAPYPATNWNYKYSETAGNGMLNSSELSVMMEGDRNVNKKELFKIAASFIDVRLLTGARKGKAVLNAISFSEESGSDAMNRVYVTAKIERTATQNKAAVVMNAFALGLPVNAAQFDNVVANYDANFSDGGRQGDPIEVQGPIELAGAFAAYLQSMCRGEHAIADTGAVPGLPGSTIVPLNPRTNSYNTELETRIVPEGTELLPDYISENHAKAIYTYWQLESTYDVQEGLVGMPVASSGDGSSSGYSTGSSGSSSGSGKKDSIAVIRLHPPICHRTVRLAGERVGERPKLPDAKTYTDKSGIKHTLLRKKVKPATSTRTADGQEIHRVDAEYHYVLSRAPEASQELEIGENPWDTLGVQTAALSGESSGGSPSDMF